MIETWMRPYRGDPLASFMDDTLIPAAAKASAFFPIASVLMALLVYWLFRTSLIPDTALDVIWLMGAAVLGLMSAGLRLVFHFIGDRVSPMIWLWISLLMLFGWAFYWALPSVLFLRGTGDEGYWLMASLLLCWAVVSAELLSVFAIHGMVFNALVLGSFSLFWLVQGPVGSWSTLLLPLMLMAGVGAAKLLSVRRFNSIRLNLENEHLKQQHQNSVQARARLLGAVSNDLHQPLQAFGLQLEQLPRHLSTARGRELVSLLEGSTVAMEGLLKSLSDLSMLDRQAVVPKPEHVALGDVLQEILGRYRREAQSKGLGFRVIKNDDVAEVDPLLIGRVMDHIVCNSVRYTQSGEVSVAFRKQDSAQLEIVIEDSGCGVAKTDMARIFEEFVQVEHGETGHQKGLGLGLTLANRLCELQGIGFDFDSEPGKGSRVRLTLKSGDPAQLPQRPAATVIQSFNGLEVLLIEPDASVRGALSSVLGQWGCQVQAAETRWAGLCLLDDGWRPKLVIADNGGDEKPMGLAAIVAVWQALNEEIDAIILASHTASLENQTVRDAGIVVLEKPASQSDLRQAIAQLQPSEEPPNPDVTCNDSQPGLGQVESQTGIERMTPSDSHGADETKAEFKDNTASGSQEADQSAKAVDEITTDSTPEADSQNKDTASEPDDAEKADSEGGKS